MDSHNSSKKRKTGKHSSIDIDTSKPSAVFVPTTGRHFTLSVALPGSIIANAQTHDLKTLLAGQIARALAVFCVDEVIVFDDGQSHGGGSGGANGNRRSSGYQQNPRGSEEGKPSSSTSTSSASAYTGFADPNHFLAHLLAYLETPPHLRRLLFPLHPDLRTAGTLSSLDMPHHLRAHEWCRYREGVSLGPPPPPQADGGNGQQATNGADGDKSKKKKKSKKQDQTEADSAPATASMSLIEVGFDTPIEVPGLIPEHARVTVDFGLADAPRDFRAGGQACVAVTPSAPREAAGYYWGYQVRSAASLSAVFTEAPFDGGYDLTWGTSERGRGLEEITTADGKGAAGIPAFRHMLVVFGGVAGLEVAARADAELAGVGVTDPQELFDYWVNLCPGQGSRTIRTEEAVWIGLMGLRGVVQQKGI